MDLPHDDGFAEAREGAHGVLTHGAVACAGGLLVERHTEGIHVLVASHGGNLVDGVATVEVAPGAATRGIHELQEVRCGVEAAVAVTVHLDDGAALQAAVGDELEQALLCLAVLRLNEEHDLLAADGGVFAAFGHVIDGVDSLIEGGDGVQADVFAQVFTHVNLVAAQLVKVGVADDQVGAGSALDVGVVHADKLTVAGGAHGDFDGQGAAAYCLCVSVGGMFGVDVARTAVRDEEFIGLVQQLVRGGSAVYRCILCAGVGGCVGLTGLQCEGRRYECGGTEEAAAAHLLGGVREYGHRSGPFSVVS